MDIGKLVARAKNITLSPETEWPVIAAEPATIGGLYAGYVAVLAAIGPVAGLVGTALWGVRVPLLGTVRPPVTTLVAQLIGTYLLALAMTYVVSWLVNQFAPKYGGQKDSVQAFKTAAYCFTPVWVVGALRILPGLGFLAFAAAIVAAVYAFRILRLGLQHTMKADAARAGSYAGLVVVAAIAIDIALSLMVGGATFAKRAFTEPSRGTTESEEAAPSADSARSEHADPASPLGKLEAWSQKMEKAGKRMEAAEKAGDTEAQTKALGEVMGALLGGGDQVEALAADKIKTFLPETLAGRARKEFSAERNAAMGIQIAEAKASYANDEGETWQLQITDTGSTKGIMMFAGWAMLQQERQTDRGYEKSYKSDGRLIHEKWDTESHDGEYAVVVANRFVVTVSGTAPSIDALKEAVGGVDLNGLEALKDEGVKKG
ncbi:MAG: Yip1 family protein [bacterium]